MLLEFKYFLWPSFEKWTFSFGFYCIIEDIFKFLISLKRWMHYCHLFEPVFSSLLHFILYYWSSLRECSIFLILINWECFEGKLSYFFVLLQSLWQCLVYYNDNKYLLMNWWSSWWLYLLGIHSLKTILGTSLAVQWLRLYTLTAGAWVWPLVGELRSPIPHGQTRK